MFRLICGLLLLVSINGIAQRSRHGRKHERIADSLRLIEETPPAELPSGILSEQSRSDDVIAFLPSILSAGRDVLFTAASFHFGALRFRLRGYDGEWSQTLINGILMNNPEDRNTPWSYWSGLNDATRNTQLTPSWSMPENDIGSLAPTTAIDMRASKQKEQTQFAYSFSNRSYGQRWSFYHGRGFNRHGWSMTINASWRYAAEGYFSGTFYRGGSYYFAADKRLDMNRLLSFTVFGNAFTSGRQSPVLKEVSTLTNNRYNAYWGYQSGQKRNANVTGSHVPVVIVQYERRMDNHSYMQWSVAGMFGQKFATAPDWFNAADPRPDYYRYLPGYQRDSMLRQQVWEGDVSDPSLLQINWNRLYGINRGNMESTTDADGIIGNTYSGLRSHYVLEKRITDLNRIDGSWLFTSPINERLVFSSGMFLRWQRLHYYKIIDDLLGGEYYVDWNQFAEGDASVIQNDLQHPNRILHEGDRYGYNYLLVTESVSGWMQLKAGFRRIDFYSAVGVEYTSWYRDGLVQTGLFPDHSLGRSHVFEFTDYTLKCGLTYKINGRKHFYLHLNALTKAPLPDNVFLSPRTRDTEQEKVEHETAVTMELGYLYHSPVCQFRVSGYLTRFSHGMNVLTFYHDQYRDFVNYALTDIGKIHCGIEAGIEYKLGSGLTGSFAASVGEYYFNNRPQVTVSVDNDAYVAEREAVYLKNYRAGGVPQQAYNAGWSYQSASGFYGNLSVNYFRDQWLEINPLRRTYSALSKLSPGSDQWMQVVTQTRLPDQYTVDLSMGTQRRVKIGNKRRVLLFNLSVNNLFNKKDIISGGFEQLRFDSGDINKFPPKFFFAMGLNFAFNITCRL